MENPRQYPWLPPRNVPRIPKEHEVIDPIAPEKLCLIDLDRRNEGVWANYNPKEIQVDKATSWTSAPAKNGDQPELTFSSSNGRTLQLELFFDCYETAEDVHETYVKKVQRMTQVLNPKGREDERRPPRVMVVWGKRLERFVGVIESVSTKYTMFMPDGMPVRATCSVKMIEGERFARKKG